MNELFQLEESLSPRLRWMKEHGVQTHSNEGDHRDTLLWGAWEAVSPLDAYRGVGRGDTEDEAIVDWANKNGVKLWNEPPARNEA